MGNRRSAPPARVCTSFALTPDEDGRAGGGGRGSERGSRGVMGRAGCGLGRLTRSAEARVHLTIWVQGAGQRIPSLAAFRARMQKGTYLVSRRARPPLPLYYAQKWNLAPRTRRAIATPSEGQAQMAGAASTGACHVVVVPVEGLCGSC
jgi:hypothetical protein